MKIRALDCTANLIESNIIESLKTRSRNRPNFMIRHKEVFFPPHEYYLLLPGIRDCDLAGAYHGDFVVFLPRIEELPVVEVGLATGPPVGVFGEEGVL